MRRLIASLLLVLITIGGLASVFGVWAERSVLDTDRFTATFMSVASTPEVTDAIASTLVDQLVLVAADRRVVADRVPPEVEPFLPLLVAAVRPAVENQVSEMLLSGRSQALLDAAVSRTHRLTLEVLRNEGVLTTGPVRVEGREVVLDLSGLLALSIDELQDRGVMPEGERLGVIADAVTAEQLRTAVEAAFDLSVPDDFGTVVVFDAGAVEQAGLLLDSGRRALSLFERAVILLVVATILLAVAAVLLSTDRRRTGLHLGLVVAGVGVIAVVISRRLLDAIPGLIEDPEARRAAALLASNLASGLVRLSEVLVVVGVIVVAAGWLAGPGEAGTTLRSRLADAGGLKHFVVANRDGVRLAGGAAAAAAILWLGWSLPTIILALTLAAAAWSVPLVLARQLAPADP